VNFQSLVRLTLAAVGSRRLSQERGESWVYRKFIPSSGIPVAQGEPWSMFVMITSSLLWQLSSSLLRRPLPSWP